MRSRKILKTLITFYCFIIGHIVLGHNPDVSNVILSKTETGQIVLQINSSLTAFQQEINYINGEGAYKTPEEFKQLVIKHFNDNFSIIINDSIPLQFTNPKVFLGHDTKFVAQVVDTPESINTITLKNKVFKDIHNNQSIIIFLLDGFPKKRFTLNRDNNNVLNIERKNNQWVTINSKTTANPSNKNFLIYIGIAVALGLISLLVSKRNSVLK